MKRFWRWFCDWNRFMVEIERGRYEWEAHRASRCRQWNYANKGPR